jgi:uncharacterized protein
MTKKRGKNTRRAKKAVKGSGFTRQLIKTAGGMTLLVLLVLGAGMLTNYYLSMPAKPVKTTSAMPAKTAVVQPEQHLPVPPVRAPEKPLYEVFPKTTPPAEPPPRLPKMPLTKPPLVAIIIDDIGYDRRIANQFLELDIPLTFSMLPDGPFNGSILAAAKDKSVEIMLHLPMEPNEYPMVKPGPGALLASMPPDTLIAQLEHSIDQFPGLRGVNNHMGSKLSTSSEHMRQIFSVLKLRGLFYIDSRTTAETVARPSASLLQLPFAERDIFIDHLDDPAFIRSQMKRLIVRAQEQGYAIGIGHPHSNTYEILKEFIPQLNEQVSLVSASTVVTHAMQVEASEKRTAMTDR